MDRPTPEAPQAAPPDQDQAQLNKRLRIVTRCSTLEEFYATFGAFADESSLFIVTNKPRPLGLKQPFVIQLRDGETIMRGDVEVIESITDGKGPDGRNGMRLKLLQIDEATRELLRKLIEFERAKRSVVPPAIDDAPLSTAVPSSKTKTEAPPRPPPVPAPAPLPAFSPTERPPPDKPTIAPHPPGERAPGSSYQLPANPFEGVTAEALESFIECTLYEERVSKDTGDVSGETPPPIVTAATLAPSSIVVNPGFHAAIPPPPPALGPPTFGAPAAPPTFGAPPPPTFGAPPPAPTFGAPPAVPEGPIRDAVLIAAAIQAASVPKIEPQRRPWIMGLIVTAAISSVASLAAAYYFWGRGGDPSPSGATTGTATTAVTAPPERTATPQPTATATATATATTSTSTSAAPVLRDCIATVRSFPLGVNVRWNDIPLGGTPLQDVAVPCGEGKVTFQLQGYETGEKTTVVLKGKAGGVFLRLTPVRVAVEVTSTPPGAQVVLDGRSMGRTPTTISVYGIRETTLMVKHPSYKVWIKTFTPEPPKLSMHADLERK